MVPPTKQEKYGMHLQDKFFGTMIVGKLFLGMQLWMFVNKFH